MKGRVLLALLALFPFGCRVSADVFEGDIPFVPPEPTVTPSAKPSATFVPTPEAPCPGTRPRDNSPCTNKTLVCEYGGAIDQSCNDIVACLDFVWTTRSYGDCVKPTCPALRSDIADGSPCALPDGGASSDEILCPYADAVCGCTTGRDGAHLHERRWVCPPHPTSCPTQRPMRGQPCSTSQFASSCDYGSCEFRGGVTMTCGIATTGTWLTGSLPCK